MSSNSKGPGTGQKQDVLLLIVVAIPLLLIGYAFAKAQSGRNTQYEAAAVSIDIPDGDAAIREGRRLSRVRGCFWCHGEDLEGDQYFADASRGIIVVAPNLTKKIREYSSAEFARAVRHGIRPDGTSLQPAMPSFAYYNMSDADMGLLLAYARSLPEREGLLGEFRLTPVGWIRWVLGRFPTNVAGLIDHSAPRTPPAISGPATRRGKYLADSVCTECHSDSGRLRVPGTPDLSIAMPYTRDEFFHLMRTGEPRHDRPIDYHMIDVSKYRYTEMTDAEIEALYSYFQALKYPVD
jgi:cytochrome c553